MNDNDTDVEEEAVDEKDGLIRGEKRIICPCESG